MVFLCAKYCQTFQRYTFILKKNQINGHYRSVEDRANIQLNTQDAALTDIPAAVQNIIGKVCIFQIKVTSYNITHGCEEYTVARVSEDSPTTTEVDDTSADNLPKKRKCA